MTYSPKILFSTQFTRRNVNLSLLWWMWISLTNRHIDLLIHVIWIVLFEFLLLYFTLIKSLFWAWSSRYLGCRTLAQLLFVYFYNTFLLLKCVGRAKDFGYLYGWPLWWFRQVSKDWIATFSWRLQYILMVKNTWTRAIDRHFTLSICFSHKISMRRLLLTLSWWTDLCMKVNFWCLRKLF